MIVGDQGLSIAVVLRPERDEPLLEQEAEADWAITHEMQQRNAHLDPDEVLGEVTETVEVVRQETYGERIRATQGGR